MPPLLYASETSAAKLLDMPARQFRDLVAAGALPGPVRVAGVERWEVAGLDRAMKGQAVDGMNNVEW